MWCTHHNAHPIPWCHQATNKPNHKWWISTPEVGGIQIRHLQATLRDAATSLAYFEYLQTKFEWQTPPATTIHWPTVQLAPSQFKALEKWILTNFAHEWLLLQDWYHVKSISIGQIRPSCWQAKETPQHFLTCNHMDCQTIWTELHQSLEKHAFHNAINPTLHNLYAYGLYMNCQMAATIMPSHKPLHQQIYLAQMHWTGTNFSTDDRWHSDTPHAT